MPRNLTVSGFRLSLFLVVISALAGREMDDKARQNPAPLSPAEPYVLHSDDEITVRSLEVKEIADKPFRLDQNGDASFPLIGRLHVAGATTQEAEEMLTNKYKTFYLDPDIAISVGVRHQEFVSVIGAVGTPGVQPIHGPATLLDVLSAAGGIRPDAGPVIKVTRRTNENGPIPYTTAHNSGPGVSVAEINAKSLLDARVPSDNILILPHDQVSVPPAEIVYVIGNVKRAGGFALGGKPNLSVLQALSLAEGLDPRAAAKHARILRRDASSATSQADIPIDLRRILDGKSPDVILRPNDILFVPSSTVKAVSTRTIEAAIQLGTGVLIFH